eukprot:TRINITY_DN1297_c0_g2_i1.p1 TRINITY_DN1297_c0_g2~~TRINITY_DN1297_c0_g2_i1.p1  ORF type:complete len:131 (+),score=21.18 TRINITY_DN1297_c0_g2_i1:234-626(+)
MGDTQNVIDVVASGGVAFVKDHYYPVFDKSRDKVFQFYQDVSQIVWNGTSAQGLQNIMQFYAALPQSSHIINTVDCQPTSTGANPLANLIIQVTGEVTFGCVTHDFTQTFILSQAGGSYFIVYDSQRLVS